MLKQPACTAGAPLLTQEANPWVAALLVPLRPQALLSLRADLSRLTSTQGPVGLFVFRKHAPVMTGYSLAAILGIAVRKGLASEVIAGNYQIRIATPHVSEEAVVMKRLPAISREVVVRMQIAML